METVHICPVDACHNENDQGNDEHISGSQLFAFGSVGSCILIIFHK